MSDSEDPVDLHEDEGDDLFGDGDDDQPGSPPAQVVSDNDLDSDSGHPNATQGYGSDREQEDDADHQDKVIAGIQIYRHRTPKTKDGMVRCTHTHILLHFTVTSCIWDGH